MSGKYTVKFWGVRGSYPTPGVSTVKYGGNTACVEIQAGDKTLVLDAGTGIISLGHELVRRAAARKAALEVALLFSHLHHDHMQGFPFFGPAYLPNTKLHIYGPGMSSETLETVLEANQAPTNFPVSLNDMAASKDICSVRDTQIIVWDEAGVRVVGAGTKVKNDALTVRIHRSYAHPGGVYVYRVEWRGRSVVYATDTEGYIGADRRLVQFAHGTDVLIHDSQYLEEHYRGQMAGFPSTQGYGHSTVAMACETARQAEARQLVLFHHDPAYDDETVAGMQEMARRQFASVRSAREGLEIALAPKRETLSRKDSGANKRDVQYAHNG